MFTNIHADAKPSHLEQLCLSFKAFKNNSVCSQKLVVSHMVTSVSDSDTQRPLLRMAQYRLRVETNKLR